MGRWRRVGQWRREKGESRKAFPLFARMKSMLKKKKKKKKKMMMMMKMKLMMEEVGSASHTVKSIFRKIKMIEMNADRRQLINARLRIR